MKPYVVGIDIGGTNTVFGIVDARGNVVASSSIKTGRHADIKDYVEELKTSLNNLLEANDATDKIAGIGVGAPQRQLFHRRHRNGSPTSHGREEYLWPSCLKKHSAFLSPSPTMPMPQPSVR